MKTENILSSTYFISFILILLLSIPVPLSFILYLLANAIDAVEGSGSRVRDIVNLKIKDAGPILFPTAADQRKWEKQNDATPMDAWNYQREKAQDSAKISAHFLKNFQEIITNFLTI